MPAPCDSGATTSEASVSRRPRHQVAQMVGDDESHLPVRQHGRLRPPGSARGEEEPTGIVVVRPATGGHSGRMLCDESVIIFAECRSGRSRSRSGCRARLACRCGVIGKIAVRRSWPKRRSPSEIGDLARRQTEIGRHPDCAKAETGRTSTRKAGCNSLPAPERGRPC